MQYLVGQMLIWLLAAGFLGVMIGWIWWGMQLRRLRERAADLEQRIGKLNGYPARLTDLEGTHAAYVASKNEEETKCKARIAELEPLAAKTPELERSLTAMTAEITSKANELAELQTKFNDIELQHGSALNTAAASAARVGELEGLVKEKDAEIAEHVQSHGDKDVRLATLSGRIAELEPVARRVPLLEEQIGRHVEAHTEKDEHLEQLIGQVDELHTHVKLHEAAHADKDAHIAELVPLAAMVPELKARIEGKDSQIADLTSQVQQHVATHADKDAHIADLVPLAAMVPELNARIEGKDSQIADLTSQVQQHVATHADKDAHIADLVPLAAMVPELNARIEGKDSQIADLTSQVQQHVATHADKDAHIADLVPLAAMVPELNARIEGKDSQIADLTSQVQQHVATHAGKDAHIAELVPLAAMVSELNARIEEKDSQIADLASQVQQHVATHAGKDAHIAELVPLAGMVPELKARVEEKDSQIADLTSQVEQHVATQTDKDAHIAYLNSEVADHKTALAEKDAHIGDLMAQVERPQVALHAETEEHIAELVAAAALVPELKTNLEEKDRQIGALLGRVQELQTLVTSHADLQYEHNLAARKLRMAETGIAAHQVEIAKLNDRLLMQKAQQPAEAPLKAMSAAAGAGAAEILFYDVTEGSAAQAAVPIASPQNHVLEFEKRIEELRNIESSKDAEIANLRSRVAEIEAAPDPDARRQILFTAKNAELTHMRGILNSLLQPVSQDDIALRAYTYAQDRGFSGGSEREDWLRAERDAHYSRLAAAWESTRASGLMY